MLPLWAYPALGSMLAATAVLSALRGTVGAAAPWLLAAAVASVPLVFAALLVGWSEFPATRIDGVQGRYFIAPALLAAAALAAPRRPERQPRTWRRAAGAAAGAVALAGAALGAHIFWVTLTLRYH
jgi:nitroreductase